MNTGNISSFRHIASKRVSDFILEQLEESIFLKEILPEEQLPPERELAHMFNASRLAVREAIAELEQRGLIEKRLGAKGGTFVLPITLKAREYAKEQIVEKQEQLKELLEYRSFIEPEAAFLAAERITDEELKLLHGLIHSSREPCTRELFRSLDVKFHLAIARAARNSFVENAVRHIRIKINLGLDLLPFDNTIMISSTDMHETILEALTDRDGAKARDLMKNHLESTRTALSLFTHQ